MDNNKTSEELFYLTVNGQPVCVGDKTTPKDKYIGIRSFTEGETIIKYLKRKFKYSDIHLLKQGNIVY